MKDTKQPRNQMTAGDFADSWPGVVMIVVAAAAIMLIIFSVASRSAVLWAPTVLLIVVAALSYTAAKQRRRKGQAASSEREQRLEQEVAELRVRVETLERIVTDDGYDLKRELANLEAERA